MKSTFNRSYNRTINKTSTESSNNIIQKSTYNIYEDYIYYQKNNPNDSGLMRMYTNGNGQELVSPGIYQNINITSNYVYFNTFNEPTPVFRQSVFGPVNVSIFQPTIE